MATLILPDNMPLAELARIAEASGKRLRYRSGTNQAPKPEDTPNGSNTRATGHQPALRLAD